MDINIKQITVGKLREELASLLHSLAESLEYIYEPGAGRRLLGLPETSESPGLPPPQELDISRCEITHIMQALYEYLDKNEWDRAKGNYHLRAGGNYHLDDYLMLALCFNDLFRKGEGSPLAMAIEGPVYGYCEYIVNTANARWTLEEGMDITIKDLALIADVTEKTVRMAANPKLPDPLKTVRSGGRTYIESEEALRWLKKRPGFRETRYFDSAEEAGIPGFDSLQKLGQFIATRRNKRGLSLKQIAETLKWSPETLAAFKELERGSNQLDMGLISNDELFFALGELLSLNASAFAINAYKAVMEHTFKRRFQQIQKKYNQADASNTEHRK